MTPHADQRPFFSIISWPHGMNQGAVVDLLAAATGMDVPTLRMRVGRAPPMIIGQLEYPIARAAVRAIVDHGGDAFAPTFDDIAALGATHKIRDLRLEPGRLVAEIWRGTPITIAPADVQILIRASLESTTTHRPPQAIGGMGGSLANVSIGRAALAAGIGGAWGLAIAFETGYLANAAGVERRVRTSDKLDLHMVDGRVLQVDGDKFGFGILGDMRGHGDKANMDSLGDLLHHLAPDAVLDPYFPLWRPPAGCDRLRLPAMKINADEPAFAFYSRWGALLYRHVMGSGTD